MAERTEAERVMGTVGAYLDPAGCPAEILPWSAMSPETRSLHEGIDAHARRAGRRVLHPDEPTLMEDLLGSAQVVSWQEGKAAHHLLGEACWSELPPLYARYGTAETQRLQAAVQRLQSARAAVVTDCGMQAVALTVDALVEPGSHVILCEQVYNKTRTYLSREVSRTGGGLTVVPDGDFDALAAAIRPETGMVFAETFTNPRLRVQDIARLVSLVQAGRATAPSLRLVIDDTIATPWGPRQPLLTSGVDVVLGSGTKALGGQDRDLWGYVTSNDIGVMNRIMDLLALRGGILDWRRARAILADLPRSEALHAQRCERAAEVAAFLHRHPRVEAVLHPTVPDHVDAAVFREQYRRGGSLLSFRVRGASEEATRHLADVLAMTGGIRYALSFDGLVTKVNHHRTVSEYFTPPPMLKKQGFDRLIRLGVGLESGADLCACLNWTLWHGASVPVEAVRAWQAARQAALRGTVEVSASEGGSGGPGGGAPSGG